MQCSITKFTIDDLVLDFAVVFNKRLRIEMIGTSDKEWEDAAQVAVKEAIKTVRGIQEIEVLDQTGQVEDPNTSKITQYKTCI
jgi:dodecin